MEQLRDSGEGGTPEPQIELSAEDARGAEISLRSRARRIVFMAGLAGFVLFVLVFLFIGSRG